MFDKVGSLLMNRGLEQANQISTFILQPTQVNMLHKYAAISFIATNVNKTVTCAVEWQQWL